VVLSFDCEVAMEEFWRDSFDLIISDWNMPKVDGFNFLRLGVKAINRMEFVFIGHW
jgi:DNA-binding response OmpR family regulator